jgi:glycosyltransferase involved in cell wall biosynthesis
LTFLTKLATNIGKMKILLIGEFSRLHNSLKEGLETHGHKVILANNGDSFKNYHTDINCKASFFKSKIGNIFRQIYFRIFKFDLVFLEHGFRFWWNISKFKDFDLVQLINEKPIQTIEVLEYYLLKKIIQQNKRVVLLCSGVDYFTLTHMLTKKERYSIMNPYFENIIEAKNQYDFMFKYGTKGHIKIHDYLVNNCFGIIATDLDYVNPLIEESKYLGMIPNPVNFESLEFIENSVQNQICVFLGINSGNSYTKGVHYFEKALAIIREKYSDKVEIIVTGNIPYHEYILAYNKAHIVLDQVFTYDQGYNALEAMAKGKVVFTGAETEFLNHYNLKEDEVAINALPNVDYLVEKLSFLIEHPKKINEISECARNFIKKEHHYKIIAEKYLACWFKK